MHEFRGILQSYQIVNEKLIALAARVIPAVELTVGAGLLIPQTQTICCVLAVGLLLTYAIAMALNIKRGNVNIDCGCSFGALRQTISSGLVWRNIFLSVAATSLLLPVGLRETSYYDYGIIVFGAVQFSLLYLTANTLIDQQLTSKELSL